MFGDPPHSSGSVLSSIEALTHYLASDEARSWTQISEAECNSVIGRYRDLEEQEARAEWSAELPSPPVSNEISIFVSYGSTDAEDPYLVRFVEELVSEARIQTGRICSAWLDRSRLKQGVRWLQEIMNASSRADVVLALLSPSFFASQVCLRQMTTAAAANKRILPVVWVSTHLFKPVDNPVNQLQWYRPPLGGRDLRSFARTPRYRSEYGEAVNEIAARLAEMVLSTGGKPEHEHDPLREGIRELAVRYNKTRDVMTGGAQHTMAMERIADRKSVV